MTLHTNKIVFRGHSDKICDQISDALLTEYLKKDPTIKCDIRTVGNSEEILIAGTISNNIEIDVEKIVKNVLDRIGYSKKIQISNRIVVGELSNNSENKELYGYASADTEKNLPLIQTILQEIAIQYDNLVYQYPSYFYPDGEISITGCYDDDMKLIKIKNLIVKHSGPERHKSWSNASILNWTKSICGKYNIPIEELNINIDGEFIVCGLDRQEGISNNQVELETYLDFSPIGNNNYSGKDPSQIERSGSYKARQLAIKILKEFSLNWCSVKMIYNNTNTLLTIEANSDKGIIEIDKNLYPECSIENIIKEFDLINFDYNKTSKFGQFGLDFPWEK